MTRQINRDKRRTRDRATPSLRDGGPGSGRTGGGGGKKKWWQSKERKVDPYDLPAMMMNLNAPPMSNRSRTGDGGRTLGKSDLIPGDWSDRWSEEAREAAAEARDEQNKKAPFKGMSHSERKRFRASAARASKRDAVLEGGPGSGPRKGGGGWSHEASKQRRHFNAERSSRYEEEPKLNLKGGSDDRWIKGITGRKDALPTVIILGDALPLPPTDDATPPHFTLFDNLTIDEAAKVRITPDGYLTAMPRVAKVGIQMYSCVITHPSAAV